MNSHTSQINNICNLESSTNTLKVLIVSQKGGVGKSTLSANYAAWNSELLKKSTILLDFDPHGSASTWVNALKPKNLQVQHTDISDYVAQRWFISARSLVRKNSQNCELLITDLTWTNGMNTSFVSEFDIIIIPCSVSEIELEATQFFATLIIDSYKKNLLQDKPLILLCPSQVSQLELKTNPFAAANFNFPYLLLPPIPSNPEVRKLFKKGFVYQSSLLSSSFVKCFTSINEAGKIKLKEKLIEKNKLKSSNSNSTIKNKIQTTDNAFTNENFEHNYNKNVWLSNNSQIDTIIPNKNTIEKVSKILNTANNISKKKKKTWFQKMRYWS
jgi:cellulose biosynthesis protein BcsQ